MIIEKHLVKKSINWQWFSPPQSSSVRKKKVRKKKNFFKAKKETKKKKKKSNKVSLRWDIQGLRPKGYKVGGWWETRPCETNRRRSNDSTPLREWLLWWQGKGARVPEAPLLKPMFWIYDSLSRQTWDFRKRIVVLPGRRDEWASIIPNSTWVTRVKVPRGLWPLPNTCPDALLSQQLLGMQASSLSTLPVITWVHCVQCRLEQGVAFRRWNFCIVAAMVKDVPVISAWTHSWKR